jgi:hypothetical protein
LHPLLLILQLHIYLLSSSTPSLPSPFLSTNTSILLFREGHNTRTYRILIALENLASASTSSLPLKGVSRTHLTQITVLPAQSCLFFTAGTLKKTTRGQRNSRTTIRYAPFSRIRIPTSVQIYELLQSSRGCRKGRSHGPQRSKYGQTRSLVTKLGCGTSALGGANHPSSEQSYD